MVNGICNINYLTNVSLFLVLHVKQCFCMPDIAQSQVHVNIVK